MDTEAYAWLGVALPQDVAPNRAFFTPLAFYDDDIGSWQAIDVSESRYYFPKDGKAIIFEREWHGCEADRLYHFQPESNTQSKRDPETPGYARYWIPARPEPTTLARILDWTQHVASPEDLPDALASWHADARLWTHRIYVRHGNLLYGPIQLDERTRQPREYAQSSATGGPRLLVRTFAKWTDARLDVTVGGRDVLLVDEGILGTPDGEEDWSLPQVVIKQALEASNALPAVAAEEGRLVDRRVRELARLSSQEGPQALRLPLATLRRAQHVVERQLQHIAQLDELGSVLVNLPALRPRVDAAIVEAVRARSEDIAHAAQQEVEQRQQRLQQMRAEIADTEMRLGTLQADISQAQERKERLEHELETFERHLSDRIEQLHIQPLQALADLELARLLLPALADGGAHIPRSLLGPLSLPSEHVVSPPGQLHNGRAAHSTAAANWATVSAQAQPATRPEELKRHWVAAAQRYGVRSQAVRACAATLMAGLVPVPHGDRSLTALRAVADVIAGGRIFIISMPMTALSPLDLFGAIDPTTRTFIPAAGALGDLILAAQSHPDDLGLVVFVGLDRVPGMPTYAPLLRQYVEVQASVSEHAPPSLPIGLFHPRALAEGDPYVTLAALMWPGNLLLAATLDESAGVSFPAPDQCASWLVHVNAMPAQGQMQGQQHAPAAHVGSVTAATWAAWCRELCLQSTNNQQEDDGDVLSVHSSLRSAMIQLGTRDEHDIAAVFQADYPTASRGAHRQEERDTEVEGSASRWR